MLCTVHDKRIVTYAWFSIILKKQAVNIAIAMPVLEIYFVKQYTNLHFGVPRLHNKKVHSN